MAPSGNNNEENNENTISVALAGSSINGSITVPAYGSKVLEFRFNEYTPLESFITLKALKARFTKEELDDGWLKSSDQSWKKFGDHGQAYVQYMAEASYWCWMFHDEVFPGRNPVTGEYHMYTHTEIVQNPELCYKEPEQLGRSRSPSVSSEPPIKRARASSNNDR